MINPVVGFRILVILVGFSGYLIGSAERWVLRFTGLLLAITQCLILAMHYRVR